jgi:CubicO group peptidase (beta-lactamase class C family)
MNLVTCITSIIVKSFVYITLTTMHAAIASQPVPTIDIHKIKSTQLLTGPYSYFVPPYNFYYFHHMDKLDFKFDWIRRAGKVYPLQESKQSFTTNYTYKKHIYTLEQYMKRNAVTGFLVLKDNQVIYERYFHGADQQSRFLTNSVGKSITSTLLGIALDEGKIGSVNDPIINYLPWLNDSGYNRVTLKQALQMATGVDLSYNPYDPNSSTHRFNAAVVTGVPTYANLLKAVKANPKIKPGDVFDYENENSQAIGFVIEKATGMPFNEYLQNKIWSKIGAQSDAFLYRSKVQPDQCAFGCVSATLRDYARFGLMMMNGGILGGTRIVSSSWIKEATSPTKFAVSMKDNENLEDSEHLDYGYQWWIPIADDHAFKAMGIFGQIIYVNSTKHIVIVQTAAWLKPEENNRWDESAKAMDAIVAAIS